MTEWPTKGDPVFIPQKVQVIRFNEANHPVEGKMFDKPTLAVVYENYGRGICEVIIDNQIWSVNTELLNKGEAYASKIDRGL